MKKIVLVGDYSPSFFGGVFFKANTEKPAPIPRQGNARNTLHNFVGDDFAASDEMKSIPPITAKITPKRHKTIPIKRMTVFGLFGVFLLIFTSEKKNVPNGGSERKFGGRERARTFDLYHVKVAL